MNTEITQLSERVARLEKKNSFQQRIIFSLAGIIFVFAFLGLRGNSTPKIIEAEKFVLRDPAGKIRSAWGNKISSDTIQPRLEFYSEFDDTTIMLGYEGMFNSPKLLITEPLLSKEKNLRGDSAAFMTGLELDAAGFSQGEISRLDSAKNPMATKMMWMRNNWFAIMNMMNQSGISYNDDEEKFEFSGKNPSMAIRRSGKVIWTTAKKGAK